MQVDLLSIVELSIGASLFLVRIYWHASEHKVGLRCDASAAKVSKETNLGSFHAPCKYHDLPTGLNPSGAANSFLNSLKSGLCSCFKDANLSGVKFLTSINFA